MQTSVFDEQYKRLNKGQKEAVDSIEGPVMVIAGPGTGKTTILTLRIANILRLTDTPASGILALTFTEAGVKAMRIKLREIVGARANEVRIHTFHGFAKSIIGEFPDHFPHLQSEQLSDIEAEQLIRDILMDKKFAKLRPVGEPDSYVSKILSTISTSKKEAWTPEMLKEFALSEVERIKEDPTAISSRGKTKGSLKGEALERIEKCEKTLLFAEVYSEYERIKRERKLLDFDDLIFELLKALETDEILLRQIQENYLYILVDEHQDSNDSQNMIIKIIADFFDTPNLFIVGDEKQAIYRFQGASVENFLKFEKMWGSMKLIPLTVNYRSHQKILDAAYGLIEHNYEGDEYKNLRIKLDSLSENKSAPISVVKAPDEYSEGQNLVSRVKEIVEQDSEATVAIIVRKNFEASDVAHLLDSAGIEYSAEAGAEVFGSTIGEIFFSLAEYFVDQSKVELLGTSVALGLWGLDFKSSTVVLKSLKKGELPLIKGLETLHNMLKTEAPLVFLTELARLSGLIDIATKDPRLMRIWRSLYSLAESIVRQKRIESPLTLFEELISYKKSSDKRTIKFKKGVSTARVSILTVHGSKGLEYDYVFMPRSTEESWSLRNRGSSFVLPKEPETGDSVKDERRLFYVGITRARKHVELSFAESDELGKPLTPLRFLDEIDPEHVSQSVSSKVERDFKEPKLSVDEAHERELLQYIKSSILEKGLSVTALNHFITCPNQFIYKSILKVPEPPSASSEKGNAMHEAMRNVWIESRKSSGIETSQIDEIIQSSVINFFGRSLLDKNEREVVLEELTKSSPKVAECLTEHFNQKGEAHTETWRESIFDFEFEGKKHSVTLHGKLDAVLETDTRVSVYDYKTKEGMSEKAIRGETASDDGGYMRQLIFYKILIDSDSRLNKKESAYSLIFLKPNKSGNCPEVCLPVTPSEVESLKDEIRKLLTSTFSGAILTSNCSDPKCPFCAMRRF